MNGAGTFFDPPLDLALKHMEANNDKYKNFVVCMMTDGQAAYPNVAVEAIKKSAVLGKMKFKAVAYTGGSDALKQIANNLNGEYVTTLQSNQLANAFISLVARKKTAAPTAPLWDTKKFAVDQVLSMRTYYNVTGIAGNTVTVDDQNGSTVQVSRDILEKMVSGTHYAKEVHLTMSGLAELIETFSDSVFTVSFHKQPTIDGGKEALDNLKFADLQDKKKVADVAKHFTEGELTTMICHLVKVENNLGRSTVIDLTAKTDNKFRQVDHRTIESIIFKNVKYSLKKGAKKATAGDQP
jgi:hypothetical protein